MSNLEGLNCWEDDHGCICGNDCDPNPHDWYTPKCQQGPDCGGCMWCTGGLETCKTCGAFEGATPDHCPGERMTAEQDDAVYKGKLNYRNGQWREECAQVMRPVYDLDNWMLENGYRRDGSTNAGNPAFIRISET